uniref:Nuclear receptor coactivator 6 n=1 Tax=Phallusia mammillata TaxID=59560 RepID=A0A6F9DMU1_9ASCI|nr:nuclear receptor coactivator 6 [Phallusia mammillata]
MNVSVVYEGNYYDGNIKEEVENLKHRLSGVIGTSCVVTKVEPWNSVKVTFSIPREAANKLKMMAMSNNNQLNELGILSVQVEGEDIIKLSFSDGEGSTQQVVFQQQPDNRAGNSMQVMGSSGNAPPHSQLPIKPPKPVTAPATAPKKRTRKPKEKIPPKAAKMSHPKVAGMPQSPVQGGMTQPHFMSPSSSGPGGQYGIPQQSHTQLSPSVEEMVSEAWNQQMQNQSNAHPQPQAPGPPAMPTSINPEEDIMGIQLQSLLSGHNVTTGQNNTSSNFSDSFESQSQSFSQISSTPGQIFSPDNIMTSKSKTQQHSSAGFAVDNPASNANKQMPGQGASPAMMNIHNQHMQDNNMMNQQLPAGGMEAINSPHSARTPISGNNFPTQQNTAPMMSSGVDTNQLKNSPQNQWSNQNILQRSNSTQGPMYKQAMVNPATGQQQFHQHVGMPGVTNMPTQAPMQHPMTSPGSANQTQFPFSYNNQTMAKAAEMQQEKGMSMASPLLVNLLQTEASAGMANAANQQPIMGTVASAAGATTAAKPKRKKPQRKKKPPKTPCTPPGGATQFPGMFGQGEGVPQQPPLMENNPQFMNQRFPQFKMQDKQGMHPNAPTMNPMIRGNFPDPKSSVIETISRSDVGTQGMSFTGNVTSVAGSDPMMPMSGSQVFQRHVSIRQPLPHGFPPGFDPSKVGNFQNKHLGPNVNQQPVYMNQMGNQFTQFDPNQQRTMAMQPQHPQMQQQMMQQHQQQHQQQQVKAYPMQPNTPVGNFQPGVMPPNHGQQFQMVSDPMHGGQQMGNPAMTGQVYMDNMGMQQNINNSNNRMFPNASTPQSTSVADFKHTGYLPTLPQTGNNILPYQARPPQPNAARPGDRSKTTARLPNGALSIIMKGPCVCPDADKSPTSVPRSIVPNRPSSRSNQPKKSPGSSYDPAAFSTPSPKMGGHGVSSPRLQSPLQSPSPIGSHGSRSGTPKPRNQGTVSRHPTKQSPASHRRPSLDQYMSPNPAPNRGFASAPATPTNMPPTPNNPNTSQVSSFNYQPPAADGMTYLSKPEAHFNPHENAGSPGMYWQPQQGQYPMPQGPPAWHGDHQHPNAYMNRNPGGQQRPMEHSPAVTHAKSPRAETDKVNVQPVGGAGVEQNVPPQVSSNTKSHK